MKILPKVVQTLITSTPDATRIQDGLKTAVQPTLDFLNTFFRSAGDGSLQVLSNLYAPVVTAASIVSGRGFEVALDMGAYCNSSVSANTYAQTQRAIVNSNNNTLAIAGAYQKMPRSGSIVGYSYAMTGSTTGDNFLQFLKNGTAIQALKVGTGYGTFSADIPKNSVGYTFAAQDTLTVACACSTTGNFGANVTLFVEMSA